MDSCLPWLIKKIEKRSQHWHLVQNYSPSEVKVQNRSHKLFPEQGMQPCKSCHSDTCSTFKKNQQLPQPIYCVKITSLLTLRHYHLHFHSWSLNYQLEWVYQCESEVPWEESKSYFKAVSFSKQHIISDALITNPRDCNNWILKSLL